MRVQQPKFLVIAIYHFGCSLLCLVSLLVSAQGGRLFSAAPKFVEYFFLSSGMCLTIAGGYLLIKRRPVALVFNKVLLWSQIPIILIGGFLYTNQYFSFAYIGYSFNGWDAVFIPGLTRTFAWHVGSGGGITVVMINPITLGLLIGFSRAIRKYKQKVLAQNKHKIGHTPSEEEIKERSERLYE